MKQPGDMGKIPFAERLSNLLDRVGTTDTAAGYARRVGVLILPIVLVALPSSVLLQMVFAAMLPDRLDFLAIGFSGLMTTILLSVPLVAYFVLLTASVRKAREELAVAVEAAEKANQSKSAFLANMSHEIRTPLNGVLGMTQVLQGKSLDQEAQDMVATIADSGKSLLALLNDVLDLSKVEAGKMTIAPIDADFRHSIKRIHKLFAANAAEKGIGFTLTTDDSVPQWLRFDTVRVGQCLSNLISNAVKFTKMGGVSVHISSAPVGDNTHRVVMEVRDSGIGMAPETMAKLFNAFAQADSSTTRDFGGTGLGLAISKQLANMMGGDITVSSELGKGSCFTLTFLAERAAPPKVADNSSAVSSGATVLRGARILLADDIAVNREVVKHFLKGYGPEIVEAVNGKEALSHLEAAHFDLMLLDVHMPVMDGIETIKVLRSSGKPYADMPVIALTADAMAGDRENLMGAGMSGYVSKPIDLSELITTIAQHLSGDSSARLAPAAAQG